MLPSPDLPECGSRRSLSVSGFAPGTLCSASSAAVAPGLLALPPRRVHRYGMKERVWIARHGFWPLALLWLPIGIAAQAGVRFMAAAGARGEPHLWPEALATGTSLVLVAPCGLALALGCRRIWCLRYRRAAWIAGIGLGAVTASLAAGLLGPIAIAINVIVVSPPIWGTWWWLVQRG